MTMFARLDEETRLLHGEIDRGWRRFLRPQLVTRHDYVRQLCVTYGFEAPFEAVCAYTRGLQGVIDFHRRARSGLIAHDLLVLGWRPELITNLYTYPMAPFDDAIEALAWMYVVERPALIYGHVRDQLVAQFPDLAHASRYLTAFAGQGDRRWAELDAALDQVCTSKVAEERAVAAAKVASESLAGWIRSHGPALRIAG
jgi:heme oxygenase